MLSVLYGSFSCHVDTVHIYTLSVCSKSTSLSLSLSLSLLHVSIRTYRFTNFCRRKTSLHSLGQVQWDSLSEAVVYSWFHLDSVSHLSLTSWCLSIRAEKKWLGKDIGDDYSTAQDWGRVLFVFFINLISRVFCFVLFFQSLYLTVLVSLWSKGRYCCWLIYMHNLTSQHMTAQLQCTRWAWYFTCIVCAPVVMCVCTCYNPFM